MAVFGVYVFAIFQTFCFYSFGIIHGQDIIESGKQKDETASPPKVQHRLKAWVKHYDPIANTVTLKWKPPAEVNKLLWTRVLVLDENNTKIWNFKLTQLASENIVYDLKYGRQYRAKVQTTTKLGHTYFSRWIPIQINECTACHREYGRCSDGFHCVCVDGWEGQFCHQCRRKPGCVHGTCESPGECTCHPGWAGELCSSAVDNVTPPIITNITKPIPWYHFSRYDVNITWEDTMTDTSNIIYIIHVNKTVHDILGGGVKTYNATGENRLQVELFLNYMYDIRIQVARGDNYSRSSRPVMFSTYFWDGIGEIPKNIMPILTEARKITVVWDPPKNYVYCVLGYSVSYKQKCGHRGKDVEVIIGNQTTYTFENLTPFCRYKFKIAAINTYGQTNKYDFHHCTLPESVPAPRYLSVKFWTREQITLEWDDPRPHDFDCYFRKTFTVLLNGTTIVHVSRNEFSDLTLEPNRKYMFQVRKDLSVIGKARGPYYGQILGNVSSPYSEVFTVITDGINRDLTFQDIADAYDDIRLPSSIVPTNYRLQIKPHIYDQVDHKLLSYQFEGSVVIEILCKERTNVIRLHSLLLNHTGIRVTDEESRNIPLRFHGVEPSKQFLTIALDEQLQVGNTYFLQVEYTGWIFNDLKGFYYSTYKDGEDIKYIFSTQMQPTDARKVLPCFDEPALKATFDITLITKPYLFVLSNMPEIRLEERNDGYVAHVFNTTARMSTYLLSFAMGNFSFLETESKYGTQFRTWSRTGVVNQSQFALDIGEEVLTFFEEYFNISYPLPKMDMIGVPEHIFNAMENWGLIAYREEHFLLEDGLFSQTDKEETGILVSHEISHQWFGNLVTPSWWDGLWLNEGFATYMMMVALDAVRPEWKMFDKFLISFRGLQNVFAIDDTNTTHPIYIPVYHPEEINQIFDHISYAKGASVIRMLEFFLGKETFRRGLVNYIRQFSYKAANHDDLWYALSNQSRFDGHYKNVKKIMDTWILQKNYPVIDVKILNGSFLQLRQSRFLINEDERKSAPSILWEVPFSYITSQNPAADPVQNIVWLHKENDNVVKYISNLDQAKWIHGNPQQFGYYRVNYEQTNWDALIKQLSTDHKVFQSTTRSQIIDDAWNLARAGYISFETALGTLDYLDKEQEYVPWMTALNELRNLRVALQLSPAYGYLKVFIRSKLKSAYQAGHDGSDYKMLLHSKLAEMACQVELQACVDDAVQKFQDWIKDSEAFPVDPNYKTAVYCTGVSKGGARAWEIVFQKYTGSDSARERKYLMFALSCSKEPWLISKYLHMTVDSNAFSKTEAIQAFSFIAQTPIGRLLGWDFLAQNWDFFFETNGAGLNLFPSLIKDRTDVYYTQEELQQLENFVSQKARSWHSLQSI